MQWNTTDVTLPVPTVSCCNLTPEYLLSLAQFTPSSETLQMSHYQCPLCPALIAYNHRENTQKYEVLLNNLIADFTILSIPIFFVQILIFVLFVQFILKVFLDQQKDSNEPSVRHVWSTSLVADSIVK